MLASSNPKGTIFACNLFYLGPDMLAIIENLFWRDPFRNHSHVTLGRVSTLQAYLVPNERACKQIWSLSDLSLQAYLVPFIIEVASILCPH